MASYQFGSQPAYEISTRERCLWQNGTRVAIGSRALEVLIALVERAGEVVSRRELIGRVWPDGAVEENNLNVQIAALRKLLHPQAIVTVTGRGYSFIPKVRATPNTAEPPPPPPSGVEKLKTNLPASLPPLIGRDRDISILESLIPNSRLITVSGAGGIGKTALVRHLLRRLEAQFRHGVCFVDLSARRHDDEVCGAIASALGVYPGDGEPLTGLADALMQTEILVALDGAEHLLEGVTDAAKVLHDSVPGLRIIVTSQAPLKLTAETVHMLGPLGMPEGPMSAKEAAGYGAIALFVERAKAADSRFVITDATVPAVIQLCRALDGLPLALELAASRAPALGVELLAQSIQEPLALRVAANRDTPERHHTLRNALAWSHGLLSAKEQTVFRRLAVFEGSSDLALIDRVVCDPPDKGPLDSFAIVDALASLVERSLVVAEIGQETGMRYRLLDTPRAYAREQLSAAGECDGLAERHARAVAARFEQAFAERYSAGVCLEAWLTRQRAELGNGRAALAWSIRQADSALALMLLPGLFCAIATEELRQISELIDLSAHLVQGHQDSSRAMWTMVEVAQISARVHPRSSVHYAEVAESIARRCAPSGDNLGLYRALCARSLALLMDDQTALGDSLLAEARALEQASWAPAVRVFRWLPEVWLADRRGDHAGLYESSLQLAYVQRQAGYPEWAIGLTLLNGALAHERTDEAVRHGRDLVARFEGTRLIARLTDTRIILAAALLECGQLAEARHHIQATWACASHISRPDVWADYHALLCALEGRTRDAARLMGLANELCAKDAIARTQNEARAHDRTLALLRASMDPADLRFLMHEGSTLQAAEIASISAARPTPQP